MCERKLPTFSYGKYRETILDIVLFTSWIVLLICNLIILVIRPDHLQSVRFIYRTTDTNVCLYTIIAPCGLCALALTCMIYIVIKIYVIDNINGGLHLCTNIIVVLLSGLSISVVNCDVCVIVFALIYSVSCFDSDS